MGSNGEVLEKEFNRAPFRCRLGFHKYRVYNAVPGYVPAARKPYAYFYKCCDLCRNERVDIEPL